MSIYLGEIAAIFTALCWSSTAIFFSLAGRQVGSMVVNRVRLLLAVFLLILTHWLLLATPLPLHAEADRWLWLSLSGVIGLALADAFLFQAYVWIGPRLGMLMMSLAPVISALLAWLFLDEVLTLTQITGILLTVGGIGWVILERNERRMNQAAHPNYGWGLLFGLGAATGQALGLITAKKGLGGDFSALSGNLIRMLAAASVMWSVALVQQQAGPTLRRFIDHRPATFHIVGGTVFGPFIGVWLSLIAIQLTQIGVASTLMALPPIFLLPVGYFFFKERFGWPAIIGTLIAVVGVALLFLA